jgi:hypothetical protein
MTTTRTAFYGTLVQFQGLAAWMTCALILGIVGALAGLPFFYALITIAALVIFASVVAQFPSKVMVASVWALALCPFSYGIETGFLPKIFGDEMLLLLYLAVLIPVYLVSQRAWQSGLGMYLWGVVLFVAFQCISLFVGTDLIAFRNFLETDILGGMLLVLFMQETSNADCDESFANGIIWLTVVIAVLSALERGFQRNPILERLELETGFLYFSPQIIALTEGVYRPYVTFFHPSETATFMAMGIPFAVRAWLLRRCWLRMIPVLLIAAGLFVNATRGVWVAVAVSLLLLARRPILIVVSAIPALGIGGFVAYLVLRSTPFMQRLSDLNNLLARFVYWQLGFDVFADNKLLGIGHMQFQKVYLDYVHDLNDAVHVDIKQIYVMDNMYLTTLVEHGALAFIALIVFIVITARMLSHYRSKLLAAGLLREASLLRATQLVLAIYALSGFFADVHQFTKASKFFFILIGFGIGTGHRSLSKLGPLEYSPKYFLQSKNAHGDKSIEAH